MGRLRQHDERGFTLIELLVVMIIIGILAAIAVPVFLSQRQKARDTATKSDVTRLGKEVAAYYVDGTAALAVDLAGNTATVRLAAAPSTTVATVKLTSGTELQPTAIAGSSSTTWCVALTNPSGSQKTYFFSATAGLGTGSCP